MSFSVLRSLHPSFNWQDSDRIRVLYGPMRNREINPESYDAKVNFWKDMIDRWAESNRRVAFTADELESAFADDAGERPHCLREVIAASGFRREQEAWQAGRTWGQAIGGMVKMASKSILASVWNAEDFGSVRFIVSEERVKTATRKVLKTLCELQTGHAVGEAKILPRQEVMAELGSRISVESDQNLCLSYLISEGLVGRARVGEVEYYKVPLKETKTRFTEEDQGVLGMQLAKKDVAKKLEVGQAAYLASREEAKTALKVGQRARARVVLRRAKRQEASMLKLENVLQNLDSVLDRIEMAKTEEQVVKSYRAGLEVLREQLKTPEMGLDNVAALVADIGDAVEKGEALADAIASPAAVVGGESDEELEAELERLLKNDEDDEMIRTLEGLKVHDKDLEHSTSESGKSKVLLPS
jgi:charged multivesicular body protein 7